MNSLEHFTYPWKGLESFMKKSNSDKLNLLGYGSLMNIASSKETIKEEQIRIPVIAKGIIRVFDYPISKSGYIRYGKPKDPQFNAALNVYFTGNNYDNVNGILQTIDLRDISNLRERELNYDLIHVDTVKWNTSDTIDYPVFALSYKSKIQKIYPHLKYLEVCSEGALSISKDFRDYFYKNTYLFDKKTNIENWLNPN